MATKSGEVQYDFGLLQMRAVRICIMAKKIWTVVFCCRLKDLLSIFETDKTRHFKYNSQTDNSK